MPPKLPVDDINAMPDPRKSEDDAVLAVIRNAIDTLPPDRVEPPAPELNRRPDPGGDRPAVSHSSLPHPTAPRPPLLTRARRASAAWIWARIRAFQPRWWQSALMLVIASHLHNPWLLPFVTLLLFTASGMIFFAVGPDRMAELAAARYARLKQHDPAKAERLRARAEGYVQRLSRLVSVLPDRWTQGLYLPEFGMPEAPHEKMGEDPFDRLATQAQDP